MKTPSDVKRAVTKCLTEAIQLRIHDNPDRSPETVMQESLDEFNKHFTGVYKIDHVNLTKNYLEISLEKDKDFYDGEEINA